MGYWSLTDEQRILLQKIVFKRNVLDLGAGDLTLSEWCLRAGAASVTAVDTYLDRRRIEGVIPVSCRFQTYLEQTVGDPPHDVLVLSWPTRYECLGLVDLLKKHPCVVYLGKNTDGQWSGTPGMFEVLQKREILHHIPDTRNTMLVYGNEPVDRSPVLEEKAGMDRENLYFQDSEKRTKDA